MTPLEGARVQKVVFDSQAILAESLRIELVLQNSQAHRVRIR